MFSEKEYLSFVSIGTEKQRSYYIPFSKTDEPKLRDKIIDRRSSSRFISLDGKWKIKEYMGLAGVDLSAKLKKTISVPSCVQLCGFLSPQYLNDRYPSFYEPPYVDSDTPVYHYRKTVEISDLLEKYYLNFEGVDSGFYLFVNGKKVGYGQIAHSTNEFDVTNFLIRGKNVFDVVVLKFSAGTYLECQDKFRYTGIFRSVYLLKRPRVHITDYKINTSIEGEDGKIEIVNESPCKIEYTFLSQKGEIESGNTAVLTVKNAKIWSAENPYLYDLTLSYGEEVIYEKVGIRTVEIQKGVLKINGRHEKLKGVNRHESHPEKGATVSVEDTAGDMRLMKWANVNAIRTAHYPDMPEFYQLADAYGFYLIDEADVETHGTFHIEDSFTFDLVKKEANNPVYYEGVFAREVALLERDKNRPSVVMWSLGNECAYGTMFEKGADYLHARDTRPVHYEPLEIFQGEETYYEKRVDVLGCFYPTMERLDEYLTDERETRPLVICEYLHAMGNSCGGLKEYWEKIYSDDRIAGAFVWEWCDHAVKGKKGFLYGGDHGETEHDLNFCVDGLVTPDRKVKSNLLEVKAAYATQNAAELVRPSVEAPAFSSIAAGKCTDFAVNEKGEWLSFGGVKFSAPVRLNVTRAYTDNDVHQKAKWQKFERAKMQTYKVEQIGNKKVYTGRLVVNTMRPILQYTLEYEPTAFGVDITLSYKAADYIASLARVGFEIAVPKKYASFSYTGEGPSESYSDKRLASSYGTYVSTAKQNYGNYIKPQESGSHYQTTAVTIDKLFAVSAEKPFSFSYLPYSTNELIRAKHDFELKSDGCNYLNVDLTMSGVGTASCGPALPERYHAEKEGKNTFRFTLLKK